MVYCRKDCCYVYFHVLSSASLWSCRQNRLFLPVSWAPPLIGWLHFEWHATRPITGLILAQYTAVQLVNTAESAASVIATFSLTHATYNFVLTIVPSFCLFNRNFPPNNPSASSIFNSVSPSLLTACTRRFRVGENTGSKQSCVNCVKIFYRINLGHINLID